MNQGINIAAFGLVGLFVLLYIIGVRDYYVFALAPLGFAVFGFNLFFPK